MKRICDVAGFACDVAASFKRAAPAGLKCVGAAMFVRIGIKALPSRTRQTASLRKIRPQHQTIG